MHEIRCSKFDRGASMLIQKGHINIQNVFLGMAWDGTGLRYKV